MAEVLKTTAELMAAREAAARIAGELAAFQARLWWRRLVTSFSPVLSGAGLDAQHACAVVASGQVNSSDVPQPSRHLLGAECTCSKRSFN
jgi:hypothetical protein